MRNRLKEIREIRKLSQDELAERMNTTRQQISRLERGDRRLSDVWIERATRALETSAGELFGERAPQGAIPVVGRVGAGAEVFAIDDHQQGGGFDEIPPPPFDDGAFVAVEVVGDSMWPAYRPGDRILYQRDGADDWRRHVGRECVVRTKDGRSFVKILKRVTATTATLSSHNAPDIEHARVEWVAPVQWVLRAGT